MIDNKDVFGKDYGNTINPQTNQKLITWTNLTVEDPETLSYFFRTFDQMPTLEKKALELAQGKILDNGCGAGCRGQYLQNKKNSVLWE